ncbi:MAG: hypothetical protein CYG60_14325 [Actinobacteria bacterium]|nr:MAG: hypothetical protein CYG60_14325 [Actinomycetota bacterium]
MLLASVSTGVFRPRERRWEDEEDACVGDHAGCDAGGRGTGLRAGRFGERRWFGERWGVRFGSARGPGRSGAGSGRPGPVRGSGGARAGGGPGRAVRRDGAAPDHRWRFSGCFGLRGAGFRGCDRPARVAAQGVGRDLSGTFWAGLSGPALLRYRLDRRIW